MADKKKNKSNEWLLIVIWILVLVIIWLLGYFLNQKNNANLNTKTNISTKNPSSTNTSLNVKVDTVTVYDDTRCADCQTNAIIDKLKEFPELSNTNFDPYSIKEYFTNNSLIYSLNTIGHLLSGNYEIGIELKYAYSNYSICNITLDCYCLANEKLLFTAFICPRPLPGQLQRSQKGSKSRKCKGCILSIPRCFVIFREE